MSTQWIGREEATAGKHYARFCKQHGMRLAEGSMTCPFPPGHKIDSVSRFEDEASDDEALEGFEIREVPPPMAPEQVARYRETMAWVAGVFDVRGACHVVKYRASKNKRQYVRAMVRISLLERGILDVIAKVSGLGFVVVQNRGRVRDGKTKNQRFRYVTQGKDAVRFLMSIRPFLRSKRARVDEMLAGQLSGPVVE